LGARPGLSGNDRQDFPGTIKQLAAAGFQTIELCSPVGYADSGFAGLAKYTGAELRKILGDAGVTCVSSHFGIKELRENQESRIAWAKDLGLQQIIVPSLDGPAKPTLDDVKRAAMNTTKWPNCLPKPASSRAFITKTLRFRWLTEANYDVLLELLDPKLVKFSSRFPPSAADTTPPSISPSTPAASFLCTSRAGPRKPKKSCQWDRTLSIGKKYSPPRKLPA